MNQKTKHYKNIVIFYMDDKRYKIDCNLRFFRFLEDKFNQVRDASTAQKHLAAFINIAVHKGLSKNQVLSIMDAVMNDWLDLRWTPNFKNKLHLVEYLQIIIYLGAVCLGGAPMGKKLIQIAQALQAEKSILNILQINTMTNYFRDYNSLH